MSVRKVFTVFAVSVVALAVLELIFRLVVFPDWRIVSQVPFMAHPIYGTFQKPNLKVRRYNPPNYDVINRTNALGFHDRQDGFEKDLNSMWVSGLSNSYGGFVEDDENYAHVLQSQYGYNNALLASEGHTLVNQVSVMRDLYQKGYRPSMVVLELTMNNTVRPYPQGIADLKKPFFVPDTSGQTQFREGAGEGLVRRIRDKVAALLQLGFIGIKARLINNSALYAWLKVGINAIPALRKLSLKLGLLSDPAIFDNVPLEMLRIGKSTPSDHLINDLVTYTADIGNWVKTTLKADFAVILLPSKHQTSPDWYARYLTRQGSDGKGLDPARPYNLVKAALIGKGIAVLGLAKPMLATGDFLNFPDNGHFNAEGHAIIARELAGWLKSRFNREPDHAP